MMRNVLSVVAGYALWTLIFLGGGAAIRSVFAEVHDDAGLTSDVTALSAYLVLSVVASLVAGLTTAKVADGPKQRWVLFTAIALLATGIPVQLTTGAELPIWYNAAFLLLLLPVTLFGGRLGGSGADSSS